MYFGYILERLAWKRRIESVVIYFLRARERYHYSTLSPPRELGFGLICIDLTITWNVSVCVHESGYIK